MRFRIIALMIGLLLPLAVLLAQITVPAKEGFVNDFARILRDSTRIAINNWAIELKEKTDIEFAIVTMPSIGDADYRIFTTQLYNAWGIGNRRDEGVLIFLTVGERKIKIETGYGVEGYLTDAYTAEVRDLMRNFLPQGAENWDQAFVQASLMILNRIAHVNNVQLTGVPQYRGGGSIRTTNTAGVITVIALLIILGIVTKGRIFEWLLIAAIMSGRGGGGTWGGGSGGGSGGGFGGFGGFGGGRSGGGGAGGGF